MPADGGDVEARLRRDVEVLASGPRHRIADAAALRQARRYVSGALVAAGWDVARQPFARRMVVGVDDRGARRGAGRLRLHRNMRGTNLIATKADAAPPYLVVAAHLDTVLGSPGADDNASGVAVLLELARRFGEIRQLSVMLAVLDLEEVGFVGARALARRLAADHAASAMVCLESVGYYDDTTGSQRVPAGLRFLLRGENAALTARSGRGDFLAVVHRRSSRVLAERISAAAMRHGMPTVRVSDPRPDGVPGLLATVLLPPLATLDRSDHLPFWRRRIPAVMITDTANLRNANYHRPTDTPATLDYATMARVCDLLADVLLTDGKPIAPP